MKITKSVSLCLVLLLLLGTVTFALSGCKLFYKFVPVIRFAVASDVHVRDEGSDVEEARLMKMIGMAYAHAEKNRKYKDLDAVLFVGDFTQDGSPTSMQKFKSIVDANVREGTEAIVSLGNHEFFSDEANTVENYERVFGKKDDEHLVIDGFHFIKLSPTRERFSEEKLTWLRAELEEAKLDTPDRPIFVMQHHNAAGTIYGSTGWSAPGIYEVLADYPQVVDFSGHSHFPIQDERSLWQGEFTAIGTGTLSYVEMGLNEVSTDYVFPIGQDGDYRVGQSSGERDYGVFQIVECDRDGNVRLTGYDITSGTLLFEREFSTDKDSFVTNDYKAEHTAIPRFPLLAKCTYTTDEGGDVLISVPQARSKDYIESYRAKVYCDGVTVGVFYALSGQIFIPTPSRVSVRISGLEAGKEYKVEIYAVNAYGRECKKPLTLTVIP